MAAYGEVTLAWADGDYTFRLGFKQISAFEERFDTSFLGYCSRLAAGEAKFAEIREIVRLGLMGGGSEPAKALSLVKEYVEERPPSESLALAIIVAQSGAFGTSDYHAKKAMAKPDLSSDSTSPNSSEQPAQSE